MKITLEEEKVVDARRLENSPAATMEDFGPAERWDGTDLEVMEIINCTNACRRSTAVQVYIENRLKIVISYNSGRLGIFCYDCSNYFTKLKYS